MQPVIKNADRAPDSGIDGYGIGRAVAGAGSAFHAQIPIRHHRLADIEDENMMRTNFHASATADAGRWVKGQADNIFQVAVAVQNHLRSQ